MNILADGPMALKEGHMAHIPTLSPKTNSPVPPLSFLPETDYFIDSMCPSFFKSNPFLSCPNEKKEKPLMERQRSFNTMKPTRLLLFSFTIPCSLLLLFFLFPLPHPHFNPQPIAPSPPIASFSPSGTNNPTMAAARLEEDTNGALGSVREWKDSILAGAQVRKDADSYKDAILNHTHVNITTSQVRETSDSYKDAILDNTHLDMNTTNASEGGLNLVGERKSSSLSRNGSSSLASVSVERGRSCDVSLGRWVFDESYPLYASNDCPFVDEGFSCEANGRMDRGYMKWRWQPHQCTIPRLDPVQMLELIRGKRLVFVGDSINRNQWESLLCLLRGAISDPSRLYEARGRRITKERGNYNFKFKDYHCSVEYYVSHYLVHESKARVGQRRVKTLRIDTMDRSSSRWRGADIIIFNTAHWWSHYKTKSGLNYYQEGDQVHPRLDVSTAFRKALTTWATWVDQHATPGKTEVFFRSSAPSHFSGGEWNSGGHCKESKQPLNDTFVRKYPEKNVIVEEVIKQMRTPVSVLNITNLSGLRIDGHPAVYGRKPGKGPPSSIQDCSHWCLPGVPDTWNELLYYYLLQRRTPISTNYTHY